MPSSGVQKCALDRKSTRLNSSHTIISYAVFCLKKNYTFFYNKLFFDEIYEASCGCGPRFLGDLFWFFFNDTATTEIYTLSLHDALPICRPRSRVPSSRPAARRARATCLPA